MNRIREYRKMHGLSQMELAKMLNISQGSLSGYETGRYTPDIETMQRITKLFDVSMDELFGIEKQEEPIDEYKPKTSEARILSAGIDKMLPADRQRALAFMKLLFNQYEDFFNDDNYQPTTTIEGIDADVTEY